MAHGRALGCPLPKRSWHLDPDRVSYYLEHLDESTPVVVFNVNGLLLLADGHHRVAAAEQLGRSTVKADVREGQPRELVVLRPVDHGCGQVSVAAWSRVIPFG